MTKLSQRKTKLQFTTGAEYRYRGKMRAVVVEVDNEFYCSVRLAGTRQRYALSFGTIFNTAADRFAAMERDRRKQERAERRKNRGSR